MKSQQLRWADLKPGDMARVGKINKGQRDYRQKLLSMGLTPNTQFQFIRRAPLGDPMLIKVRSFFLSLRQSEADLLQLESVIL